MANDVAIENQLGRIQFLLILAVSLLSGLVFGRDYGGEAFLAVASFAVLGVAMLMIGMIQSPPEDSTS